MKIKTIEISNFKSFKELKIDFEMLHCIIGANSSGKSNFLNIFKFLRDIVDWGLENAISAQGGVNYLLNFNLGIKNPLYYRICTVVDWEFPYYQGDTKLFLNYKEIDYRFSLKFSNLDNNKFTIIEDDIKIKFQINNKSINQENEEVGEIKSLGSYKYHFSKNGYEIKANLTDSGNKNVLDFNINLNDLEKDLFSRGKSINRENLLMEQYNSTLLIGFPLFDDLIIYNIDLGYMKEPKLFTGFSELEIDGSNLAIVLKQIMENEETKESFITILKDILPFIKSVEVKKFIDSFYLGIYENYNEGIFIPATYISDGTLNIIALILIFYYEGKSTIFIEEIEKSIHPNLISKIIDLLKEASKFKQIFFTTHNPIFLRFLELNKILFINRNEDGESIINKLSSKLEIQKFLDNEIGVDELYIDDLFGSLK